MRVIHREVLLLLFLGMIGSCATVPRESDELALFERARELSYRARDDDKKKEFESDLRAVHGQLHRMLESNRLAAEGSRLRARYFRGLSGLRLLLVDRENGRLVDTGVVTQSIADMDTVASADARDAGLLGVSVGEATYSAALILHNFVNDEPRAYAYFERCADLGHAGCSNVVAHAAQYGRFGQKVDSAKAARYHKKVVETGILYRCAGSFSARSIARMVYFDGVVTPEGDELHWAQASIGLARAAATTMEREAACNLHDAQNDAYLYQLSRGGPATEPGWTHARPDKNSGQAASWALGQLILGAMNQEDFDAIVAEEKKAVSRCDEWLNAAWLFALRGDGAARSKYRSRILMEDEKECETHRRHIGKVDTLRPASPR